MNNLYLELGYNWEKNFTKQNVEYVIFSIMFTNGRFTDCVASEKCYKDSQFPDSIKVRVNIDNLEDAEKEYVLRELNAGNVKQFAYDDEPDKTYNYAIADIKPFVMNHLNDAVRRLKMNKHMPNWQKDKIMKILWNMKKNAVKINENALRQIVAESVKKILNEDSVYQMGRGKVSIDASYQRIEKALDALKHIADTMSDNGYYETEESALHSQINYIEQEINYIKNHQSLY